MLGVCLLPSNSKFYVDIISSPVPLSVCATPAKPVSAEFLLPVVDPFSILIVIYAGNFSVPATLPATPDTVFISLFIVIRIVGLPASVTVLDSGTSKTTPQICPVVVVPVAVM